MIYRNVVISSVAMALCACSTPASDAAASNTQTKGSISGKVLAETPVEAVPQSKAIASKDIRFADVEGNWDVVSFEGQNTRRLAGSTRYAFADFGESGVSLRMECNYSGRAGRIKDGKFISPRDGNNAQTVMSCGPEKNAREARYFTFFDKSPTVELLDNGRLRMIAGSTELLLERPETRRLSFKPTIDEMQGKWRIEELSQLLPGGGHQGIGLGELPGRIMIDGERLSYTRCPAYAVRFSYTLDAVLMKAGGTTPPEVQDNCMDTTGSFSMPGGLNGWDLMKMLHSNPWAEKSGERLILSDGSIVMSLTKEPCEILNQSDDHKTSWVSDCASPE